MNNQQTRHWADYIASTCTDIL